MVLTGWLINGVIAFAPVLAMLGTLRALDSFKLVRLNLIFWMLLWGGCSAVASYGASILVLTNLPMDFTVYSRYLAPLIEETLKAAALIWLIHRNRVGFLVDAAILGFALGAGFALVENVYYLANNELNLGVWLVRGFGTAVMHGGVTGVVGIMVITAIDKRQQLTPLVVAPGLLIAAAIHSAFNHFFFMPLVSALVVFWMVPFFMVWIFNKSTQALNEWLEEDFEGDAVLMEQLDSNEFSQTHVGQFLSDLRARCDPMTIVDIFCYIRLYTELSMRAKGLIIMREQGVEPPLPPGLAGQFVELRHLETALGKTAILSLGPLLQSNRRDLWHLKELESEARTTKL
mgnify:FL=1